MNQPQVYPCPLPILKFLIDVKLIYNLVDVSGIQQNDSLFVCILFHHDLLQDIKYRSPVLYNRTLLFTYFMYRCSQLFFNFFEKKEKSPLASYWDFVEQFAFQIQLHLRRIDILTILRLSIHKHGISVHLTFIQLGQTSLVAQTVKRLPTMQETWVQSLGREDLLEKEMATHSSILAWKIPWTEKPGSLQSMGSQSQT